MKGVKLCSNFTMDKGTTLMINLNENKKYNKPEKNTVFLPYMKTVDFSCRSIIMNLICQTEYVVLLR